MSRGGDTSAKARANGKKVGRPPNEKPPDVGDKTFAARILEQVGGVKWHAMRQAVEKWCAWKHESPDEGSNNNAPPHPKTLVKSDADLMLYYTVCGDLGIENRTTITLTEKRDGRAMHTVNHLHDKPLEMNVNVSMAELVRDVRLRKQEYERTRK